VSPRSSRVRQDHVVFVVDYQVLPHGWSEVRVGNGEHAVLVEAWHLSDAPSTKNQIVMPSSTPSMTWRPGSSKMTSRPSEGHQEEGPDRRLRHLRRGQQRRLGQCRDVADTDVVAVESIRRWWN
jgi:hypothetical protein